MSIINKPHKQPKEVNTRYGVKCQAGALTLGGVRTLAKPWGWDFGAGADVTFYSVPDPLRPYYGSNPVSFHVFFRIRPPAPMGRMWGMTQSSVFGR